MLSKRMDLGIAQIVFYVPAFPLAIYIFVRHFKNRPRMAWWPWIPLTLIRLVGGIITVVLEANTKNEENEGLNIAAFVLLNIGAIPLIVATQGQMRIILMDNYSHNPHSDRIAIALRLAIVAAIGLISAGGGLSSSDHSTARVLSLVGYILFAVMLAILISMELYFFMKRSELIPTSRKVLRTAMIAAPLLVVRTVYAILEVHATSYTSFWDPLYGNIYGFAFMCLLVEYIVLCLYFWLGLTLPPDRGVSQARYGEEGYVTK